MSKTDFTLIPTIPTYTENFPIPCELNKGMNGHVCTGEDTSKLGILMWESLDPDSIDRSIQPIYIRMNNDEKTSNKLNSFMDHNCDSFYNSQQRISRFPGLVYAGPGKSATEPMEY
jgi:hypothetical protein